MKYRDRTIHPSAVGFKLFLLATTLLGAVGCGDGRPTRVPVSGRVLIDGEPLKHGIVRFAPVGGRMSNGRVDENGEFKLTCFESGDGALIGEHRIAILSQEPLGQTKIKWHAPRKYNSPSSSGLTQTIDGPTDSVEINLTWDGKKGPYIQSLQ